MKAAAADSAGEFKLGNAERQRHLHHQCEVTGVYLPLWLMLLQRPGVLLLLLLLPGTAARVEATRQLESPT